MLRFPHVDSRKWNFSPKFRTTWYQLISFKSDFLPFRKFLLTKTKKKKKKNREKFLSIKIALPKKKKFTRTILNGEHGCTSVQSDREQRAGWSWREKLCNWGAGVAAPVVGKEVGWFIDLSRGLYQDGIPRRRVPSPFAFVASSSDPFFAPSFPPSKASGFEISNAVAEILLSFQSFLADAERMRSLPKVGRGQRGMPRRVFGTKVVFPRHGRVWPASKFRMSFLWNLTPAPLAAWKRIDRRVIRGLRVRRWKTRWWSWSNAKLKLRSRFSRLMRGERVKRWWIGEGWQKVASCREIVSYSFFLALPPHPSFDSGLGLVRKFYEILLPSPFAGGNFVLLRKTFPVSQCFLGAVVYS